MCSSGRPNDDDQLRVGYDGPERQLVDFGSRFGVWWDRDSPYFGVDHGGIASQREGKHFMAPLARLGVLDLDSGSTLFADPQAERRAAGAPWGFIQEGEAEAVRLRVTVAYADLDVVAVEVEVANAGEASRRLCLSLGARAVPEDWSRSVVFHPADGEVITTQTSAPTSRFQIRPEPHFDVVTGWRADFGIASRRAEGGGFCVEGDAFSLAPGESRGFSLFVSAAGCEGSAADRVTRLVRQRLAAQVRSPGEVIQVARGRWADAFRSFPESTLDASARPLVRRAVATLLRNTIRAQPEQGYGGVMGPLRGTFPSRHSYEGFWVWDSAFQALGFSEWDLDLAKENVLLMLRNQGGEGGLPMLHPDAAVPSAQPPLFSWVAMVIYEKEQGTAPGPARAFLEEIYPKLALWNRWWFRHRDRNGNGLAEWGDNLESGWDDSPRWDNADGPAGWENDFGSATFEAVDLNAYLVKDLRCLGRMAETLGLVEEARHWTDEADRLAQLVVDVLYDPQDNLFYDTDHVTGERRKVLTPASFLPLWAGVPLPEERVREMIRAYLLSPRHFFGPYPFPTVSYEDPAHDSAGRSGYWRGPVWLNVAYFMVEALAWHGFGEEARQAAQKLLAMAGRAGLHENYDSRTGEPGANSRADFSWSAAMTIALALWDLTDAQPPHYHDRLTAPSVHVGVRVRDRKVYGRAKEAWVHLANRTGQPVSGALHCQLSRGWKLLTHDPAAGPEDGWGDAPRGFAFRLEPFAHEERAVRFVIPAPLDEGEHRIGLVAVADGERPARLGGAALRLEGPSLVPLPWLTAATAPAFRGLMHAGAPFRFVHQGREIGQSPPGLVGLLNGRLEFLGRQAVAKHTAQRDFIRHALHLLRDLPAADALRRELEGLLEPGVSPQAADEESREILEAVVQQTRDAIEGAPWNGP